MRTKLENNKLTIMLEGRIDSANAPELEEAIDACMGENAGATVGLDASRLSYISSAGLRILMKLRKKTGKTVTIKNVSPEVYEIFDVTGFTDLLDVQKALREVSIDGCELLGEGANGKVYRFTPDEMVKVFRSGITLEEIEQEREASRRAFVLGVPCAIAFDTVKCGDSYGTVYELLKAATVTERIRENPDTLVHFAEESAKLLRQMHDIEVPEGQMLPAERLLHKNIDVLTEEFTDEEIELMHKLYNAIPKKNRFVHNDFHAKNVMESDGELIMIDLGDAGSGNPLIDLIHCFMVYILIGGGLDRHAADEMGFIGLTYGEMKEFWDVFMPVYCGTREEADRMNRIIEPYARMMYYTVSMGHPLLPAEYHKLYANLVRQQVFTRADKMIESMKQM